MEYKRGELSSLERDFLGETNERIRQSRQNNIVEGCNSPSPLLVDIVPFGLPFKVFKTHMLGRGFYTLIRNVSFSSSTDVGSPKGCAGFTVLHIWNCSSFQN